MLFTYKMTLGRPCNKTMTEIFLQNILGLAVTRKSEALFIVCRNTDSRLHCHNWKSYCLLVIVSEKLFTPHISWHVINTLQK